jgi:hypothetical protein
MSYHQKYLKYKTKFIELKKIIGGGKGKIYINDKEITSQLSMLLYNLSDNILSAQLAPVDSDVKISEKNKSLSTPSAHYNLIKSTESLLYKIFNIQEDNILHVSYTDNNSNIEICSTYKLFNINFASNNYNYSLYILSNISDLLSPNYFINDSTTSSLFVLNIKEEDINKFEVSGNCQIRKSEKKNTTTKKYLNEILFDVTKINNQDLIITNIIDLPNFIVTRYDFQKSYDKLKNTENYCPESTIIYKHIYQTYYNKYMIENNDLFNILYNNFGNLLEHIIFQKIKKNQNMIKQLCNNADSRKMVLSNIMKRIETTQKDGVFIRKSDDTFVQLKSLNNNFELKFDTGNASHTLITKDIVNALGLKPKKTFAIEVLGVAGASAMIKANTYVDIELYFDPNLTNINIDKKFKFRAYIQESGLTNMILLGQSAYGLKQFFDNSYCIGYDSSRLEYERKKINAEESYRKYDNILSTTLTFFQNIDNFNSDLYRHLMPDIIDMKVSNLLGYIDYDKIDELYNIKTNILEVIDKNRIVIDRYKSVPNFMDIIEKLNNI